MLLATATLVLLTTVEFSRVHLKQNINPDESPVLLIDALRYLSMQC